jgi:hypothetical protein
MEAQADAASGNAAAMQRTLHRLRVRAAGDPRRLADIWILEGGLDRAMGRDIRALAAFERAHRLDPDSQGLALAAAVAEALGDFPRSYSAYTELCQRGGTGSAACAERERVRRRMTESPHPFGQPMLAP